jgi:hypothetical protein
MEQEERLGTPPTTQDIKPASHCWKSTLWSCLSLIALHPRKLMDHEMFHPLERFWKWKPYTRQSENTKRWNQLMRAFLQMSIADYMTDMRKAPTVPNGQPEASAMVVFFLLLLHKTEKRVGHCHCFLLCCFPERHARRLPPQKPHSIVMCLIIHSSTTTHNANSNTTYNTSNKIHYLLHSITKVYCSLHSDGNLTEKQSPWVCLCCKAYQNAVGETQEENRQEEICNQACHSVYFKLTTHRNASH